MVHQWHSVYFSLVGDIPIVTIRRPCSGGTGVPVNYVGGETHPCTERPTECGGDGKRNYLALI